MGKPRKVGNITKDCRMTGLQKLRWYCQMCEKQCRDENGFKCHTNSESHQRNMMLFAENSEKFLKDHSDRFHREFISLLSTRFGTKRVFANQVYQQYISDKEHVRMNATKWMSLSAYIKYVGKEGICRVDEDEKGFYLAWIDNSPETLRKKEAVQKKARGEKSEEERERKLIDEMVLKVASQSKSVFFSLFSLSFRSLLNWYVSLRTFRSNSTCFQNLKYNQRPKNQAYF